MGIFTRIKGVFRENNNNLVKVNGVFRLVDSSVKVNGVFRDVNKPLKIIQEDEIVGFQLIYKLNKSKFHINFPYLKYNKNIPYVISIINNKMDLHPKTLLFEFGNNEFEQEGFIVYDANLFLLTNDNIYNISNIPTIANGDELRRANMFQNLLIQMNVSYRYELYGYHLFGWNNIFDGTVFEAHNSPEEIPLSPGGRSESIKVKLQILPLNGRHKTFFPLTSIGIARDTHTPHKNMVGSRGLLDHTIDNILVNGNKKPFQILYYD